MGPCSQHGISTLANPTGSPVQAPLEAEESLGARPGTRDRGQSSQYEQTARYFWLPGSVPHVVGGGHPGYSCFPFWVPTPTVGRDKLHTPCVCCGCRPCHTPSLCQVSYHQVLYTIFSPERLLYQPSELGWYHPHFIGEDIETQNVNRSVQESNGRCRISKPLGFST